MKIDSCIKLKMGFHIALLLGLIGTVIAANNEPCDYMDTVNITNAHKFENGSYLYEGILLGPHEVGEYNYVMKFKDLKVDSTPHMRGCVCLKRPCIFFCCPWHQKWLLTEQICGDDPTVDYEPMANITIDGKTELKNLMDVFTVQIFRLYSKMYLNVYSEKTLVFLQDGKVNIEDEGFTEKNDYCVQHIDGELTVFKETIGDDEYQGMQNISAYAQFVSIPFMILTICIYFYIGEVHNNYTKAFIFYLIGLIIGYIGLSFRYIYFDITQSEVWCKFSGYIAYYFFMMAFFSLNVISYDIWHNFRGTRRYENDKKFAVYAVYILITPLVLLMITVLAQEVLNLPEYLKPGISLENVCWLDNSKQLAPFIYFFGPMMLVIVANLIMFVLTAYKIHSLQKNYATTATARSNTMKHLRSERARYGLFFRLFILMGVLWIIELVAFFCGQTEIAVKVIFVGDILLGLQGLIIFVLFVLRKPVRRALLSKLCKKQYVDSDSEGSYTTSADGPPRKAAAELLNRRDTEAY